MSILKMQFSSFFCIQRANIVKLPHIRMKIGGIYGFRDYDIYLSCRKYAGLFSMLTTPLPLSSSPMIRLAHSILYDSS